MLEKLAGVRILFFQWMLLAVPILVLTATLMFWTMSRLFPPVQADATTVGEYVRARRSEMHGWTRGQKNTLAAFLVAVFLWIFPGVVATVLGPDSSLYTFCERHIPEGRVALLAALLLFFLPTSWKSRRFTLKWSDAMRIDWGTILLFGGGLSLGGLMFSTGLADALGRGIIGWSGGRFRLGVDCDRRRHRHPPHRDDVEHGHFQHGRSGGDRARGVDAREPRATSDRRLPGREHGVHVPVSTPSTPSSTGRAACRSRR